MRARVKPGNAFVQLEAESAEHLRAAYERSLDVMQRFVEQMPELAASLMNQPQQDRYREMLALLAEAGRRVRL
jgi:hypothetical protein